jgi:hypothetical protein
MLGRLRSMKGGVEGQASTPRVGPECSETREAAVAACAEADRLVQAARDAAEQLRAARRQRAELSGAFELVRLGDRQTLRAAKDEAARVYRRDYEGARDENAVMVATATWLGDVSRLNLDARRAVQEAQTLTRRQAEIDGLVERLELAAQAARVAAESAAETCVNARRALAACQDAARQGAPAANEARPSPPPPPPPAEAMPSLQRAQTVPAPAPQTGGEPAVMAVLAGDRRSLQEMVPRLAEEVGEDAGRLQLLLLDLREALFESANRACVYDFPTGHQFWSQFSLAEARAFAAALATLGRRYDGAAGWLADQTPSARDIAMAVSLAGRDLRSVRYQPSGTALEQLWAGVTVNVAEHLAVSAPDLRLESMQRIAGERSDQLSELWRNWELLRPLLLADRQSLL